MHGLTQTSHLWVFAILVAGIVVLPGMDMAYVICSSLVDGRRGGLSALAGVVAGGAAHVLMGAAGVGLILQSAPRLFNALLCAGAAYVAWLGWSLLRGSTALGEIRDQQSRPPSATFRRGLATCLMNPKAYVFMLAVFPQFMRIEHGSLVLQAFVLGSIICVTQFAVYGAAALVALRARRWLRANAAAQVRLAQGVGALLILFAAWTAWQGWQLL